ncbi:CD3324 family protein [Paenibacillus sp. CF384]|uniref:CD3324 family protein n=1 Tax=Paenibacillus sp. CF384 TaxID=1884382 RepID=UPI000894ECE0|nr:CD3324 family protein [Paenibacillus sp. CF384]SDX49000.1 Mor transcription activator family protein [Paenibacillus sp. CF384]
MNYKNGRDVLPPRLLEELQSYIQGELIYIPKQQNERAAWGEKSGSRVIIGQRNEEIYQRYASGSTVQELERQYHLSGDSIRKIIIKLRSATIEAPSAYEAIQAGKH